MVPMVAWWCTLALGAMTLALGLITLLAWVLWSWNEWRFLTPLKLRSSGAKIPPGHMGIPFFGDMLSFLWYFKILRRPDDFIISKRRRYGDGVGMYRSHLFGQPSIITCSPAINKFVLQSEDAFPIGWPTLELFGLNCLVAVTGEPHTRLRTFVVNAVNRPQSLSLMVQPLFISSLRSWADKGRIKASDETKMMFVSLEPGPVLYELDANIRGVLAGYRSQPFNFPGTAYHYFLQGRIREKKMDDHEVLGNILALIVAGYESTATATMWSLYYLSKYADVLPRLQEENMGIQSQNQGNFITMEDISQMKYTSKVVEETIRMANIAPMIYRRATEDIDYQGYRIPKDWKVVVWLRHLHTDPSNFDDPLTFNPDRWNVSPNPGTYLVFGGGPRICPGNKLAPVALFIFLHHLTTGYRWELINPDAKITYLPHPKPVDGAEMTFHAL